MAERKRELISIIVPCYNEQAAIPFFYKEIDRISQVMKEETDFELLFVDDGSKDGTMAVLRELAANDKRVRYVSFSRNFGKEAAMYAGLENARGDLVAILDADKEGFLRSETSLIQTIGRAARNAEGRVVMYADTITASMRRAIDETARRREKQMAFNEAHGIVPKTIQKNVHEIIEISSESKTPGKKRMSKTERTAEIARLTRQMKEAAKLLEFELAAELRDQIKALESGK